MLGPSVDAQNPPDLSGTWTLTSTGTWPASQRFTITQTPTALTVDGLAYQVKGSFDGTRSSMTETSYPSRTTYTLDGLEHPRRVTADPPAGPTVASAGAMTTTVEDAVCKATWVGRQLVLMTYERVRVNTPSRTPSVTVIRRTVRESLSLDETGSLVWETLVLADPFPGQTQDATSPTPWRRVFKRTPSS